MIAMLTDEEVKANVAFNLRAILTERGISQSRLAELVNDKQPNVNNILHARHVPNLALVARIADVLKTSVDRLLSEPREKKSSAAP